MIDRVIVWKRRDGSNTHPIAHVFVDGVPGCRAAAQPVGAPTNYAPIRPWRAQAEPVSTWGIPYGRVCTLCQARAKEAVST